MSCGSCEDGVVREAHVAAQDVKQYSRLFVRHGRLIARYVKRPTGTQGAERKVAEVAQWPGAAAS